MVDTRALLKTFGEGADVLAQIATDKSTNARRQTASTFDIRNGELIEGISANPNGTTVIPHGRGANAKGAIILVATRDEFWVSRATTSQIEVTGYSWDPVANPDEAYEFTLLVV